MEVQAPAPATDSAVSPYLCMLHSLLSGSEEVVTLHLCLASD